MISLSPSRRPAREVASGCAAQRCCAPNPAPLGRHAMVNQQGRAHRQGRASPRRTQRCPRSWSGPAWPWMHPLLRARRPWQPRSRALPPPPAIPGQQLGRRLHASKPAQAPGPVAHAHLFYLLDTLDAGRGWARHAHAGVALDRVRPGCPASFARRRPHSPQWRTDPRPPCSSCLPVPLPKSIRSGKVQRWRMPDRSVSTSESRSSERPQPRLPSGERRAAARTSACGAQNSWAVPVDGFFAATMPRDGSSAASS